jgi:hypothetical protein
MSRIHNKHLRCYVNGTDISGYSRSVGALNWTFDAEPDAAITDAVKNILIGKCDIQAGPISAFLDTAATRFYTLGVNIIINGTFAADTNWTKGTGWTISSTAIATAVTNGVLTATVPPLTIGKTYLVTYTVTVAAGDVAIQDGTANGTTRSTAGTFEELFTAGAAVFRFYSPSGGFTGTIDNVSVQEYSTGLNADHDIKNVMVAIGTNAAPAANDHVFAWKFEQTAQQVEQGTGFVAVTIPFGGASSLSTLTYKRPWGRLLYPYAARTAVSGVNTSAGIDDLGTTSALGGIFVYHLYSSDGTVTLSAEDADGTNVNGDFADSTLDTVATSGAIDASVIPKSGMIALATDRAVRRYLRWQIAFGTATTCNFASAFIRNNLV